MSQDSDKTQFSSGSKYDKENRLYFSQKRSLKRKHSQILFQAFSSHGYSIYKSLQKVPVKQNMSKLESLKRSTKSVTLTRKIDALCQILETLLSVYSAGPELPEHNVEPNLPMSIMDFDVGLDIYADFIHAPLDIRNDDISSRFKDDLIDPVHGIRCVIYKHIPSKKRYIILDSDEINLVEIMRHMVGQETGDIDSLEHVDHEFVHSALTSMDTEHDRKMLKSILSKLMPRNDLIACGISPAEVCGQYEKSKEIFKEIANTEQAAEDMIVLRLKSKIDHYKDNIEGIRNTLETGVLSEIRKRDFRAKQEIAEEQLKNTQCLLQKEDPYNKQKFNQCVKRLTDKLVKENRMKLRSLGAGAKPLLDSEDEQFVADAIETKSSAHGRRHDTVLYLNHRIKSEDLLSIANYKLMKRGKKMIRSAKTVHLRSRPRNIRSIEGKRHKGI